MNEIKLDPCPCCGGDVELVTSRDMNVFETYVECCFCDIQFFTLETFTEHSQAEDEAADNLASMIYNRFCKSKPAHYKDHFFKNCKHDKNYFH